MIRIQLGLAAVTSALLVLAAPTGAAAQAWKIQGQAPHLSAISVAPKGGAVEIQCVPNGKSIWLSFHPPKGWNGNKAASLRVDDKSYPVEITGGHGAILSNVKGDMGITPELIAHLRSGQKLSIEGPAAAAIAPALRTYALKQAEAAIGQVLRACGR